MVIVRVHFISCCLKDELVERLKMINSEQVIKQATDKKVPEIKEEVAQKSPAKLDKEAKAKAKAEAKAKKEEEKKALAAAKALMKAGLHLPTDLAS